MKSLHLATALLVLTLGFGAAACDDDTDEADSEAAAAADDSHNGVDDSDEDTDDDSAFVTVWEVGADGELLLPLERSDGHDITVDWGDGTEERITESGPRGRSHSYESSGVYTVTIEGDIDGWHMGTDSEYDAADQLLRIEQWGDFPIGDSGQEFSGAENLEVTATDVPDLENTTSLEGTFQGCEQLTEIPSLNEWDVSSVESMNGMFDNAKDFDQDIGDWDVSSVKYMIGMFGNAENFNQDISDWDVSSVKHMGGMFTGAENFDQDIGDWDVSSVKDMIVMFYDAENFDQDIGDWDVSSVENMRSMFSGADSFNQDLSAWDVSSVENMEGMFLFADSFDQEVEQWGWDVSPRELGL